MNTLAQTIVQSIRQPLIVLDERLWISATNAAFCRAFHVTSEEAINSPLAYIANGQWDIPELTALLHGVLTQRGPMIDYQVQRDFLHLGPRIMLLNAQPLVDPDTGTVQILLAMDDITDRHLAQMEISRQQTWFQTTLASIGDAVIATDAHAIVTYLNPVAETMTGWSQADALGKPLEDVFNIVNESTRKLVESPVSKSLRLGAIVGLANHTILIDRHGQERPIDDSASPIRDLPAGDIVGVVMVFHDITERRDAEHSIEFSEIRYRRLFEAAHDGILILDTSTSAITDVNPFMLELLGYPREYFIGKELWQIGIMKDKEANRAAMVQLHEQGSIRFENLPLQDRNGRRHPVEIVANVYQESIAQVIQCNIRDISERVRFEREREALLAGEQASRMEAEAANRSKDIFLATLSHEVRTPLNAILGWATILRAGTPSPEDLAEGMEVIERNCMAQAQLIEDVLDVSRIVSGKLQLNLVTCDLIKIISAALDTVRPSATAKQLTFETDFDTEASMAFCDTGRIQQVIWNLLVNAVKFSTSGGLVRVSLSRAQSSAAITIVDSGQGISAEFLPHVFDRFRQAENSTRRKHGGLGLGLSIVKTIVELHNGTVTATSEGEGRGATFTVSLPVRALREKTFMSGPIAADPPAVLIAAIRLDGLQVLVVDDEADARRLLAKVLVLAGATVVTAASVAEAFAAINKAVPQILISDIAMPGQDGYDLIRYVRAVGHTAKDLPAVALTAFAHKDDRLRSLLAGFQIHVSKPIDPHELIAVIATLAGRTG